MAQAFWTLSDGRNVVPFGWSERAITKMKPAGAFPTNTRRFPITECFFNSGLGRWHGFSSPYDGDGDSESRKFHNFSREFLMESARERAREMAVFLLVLVTSAWPVIYMVISVVKLLQKGAPLDQ
jgi:hypothetical protein